MNADEPLSVLFIPPTARRASVWHVRGVPLRLRLRLQSAVLTTTASGSSSAASPRPSLSGSSSSINSTQHPGTRHDQIRPPCHCPRTAWTRRRTSYGPRGSGIRTWAEQGERDEVRSEGEVEVEGEGDDRSRSRAMIGRGRAPGMRYFRPQVLIHRRSGGRKPLPENDWTGRC